MSEDLFEEIETLPQEVQAVLAEFEDCDHTYPNCEQLLQALEPLGYTFEYGLDAEPFDLRKLEN